MDIFIKAVDLSRKWKCVYGATAWHDTCPSNRLLQISPPASNLSAAGPVPVVAVVRIFGGKEQNGKLVNVVQTILLTKDPCVSEVLSFDAHMCPSPRIFASVAPVMNTSLAYFYGGTAPSGVCDDLWSFEGRSDNGGKWSPISASGQTPGPRYAVGMIVSPCEQYLILIGGITGPSSRATATNAASNAGKRAVGGTTEQVIGGIYVLHFPSSRWTCLSYDERLANVRVNSLVLHAKETYQRNFSTSQLKASSSLGDPSGGEKLVLRASLEGSTSSPIVEITIWLREAEERAFLSSLVTELLHAERHPTTLQSRVGAVAVDRNGTFALLGGKHDSSIASKNVNMPLSEPTLIVRDVNVASVGCPQQVLHQVNDDMSRDGGADNGDDTMVTITEQRNKFIEELCERSFASVVKLHQNDFILLGGMSSHNGVPLNDITIVSGDLFWYWLQDVDKLRQEASGDTEGDDCPGHVAFKPTLKHSSTSSATGHFSVKAFMASMFGSTTMKKKSSRHLLHSASALRSNSKIFGAASESSPRQRFQHPPQGFLSECVERVERLVKREVDNTINDLRCISKRDAEIAQKATLDAECVSLTMDVDDQKIIKADAEERAFRDAADRVRKQESNHSVHAMYEDLCEEFKGSAFRSVVVAGDYLVDRETAFNLAPTKTQWQRQHQWFHPPVVTRATVQALRGLKLSKSKEEQRAEDATCCIRVPPTTICAPHPPSVHRIGVKMSTEDRLWSARQRREDAAAGTASRSAKGSAPPRRRATTNRWNDASCFISPFAQMNLNL